MRIVKFILSALTLSLLCSHAFAAPSDVVVDDVATVCHTSVSGVSDTTLAVSTPFVRVEWATSPRFAPPFSVAHVAPDGDTLFKALSWAPFVVADVRGYAGRRTEVSVSAASGDAVRIFVDYSESGTPVWPFVVGGLLGVFGCALLWAHLRQQRDKLAKVEKDLENAHVRQTRKFDMATVLFADIQGFTKIAERMNPDQLVDELDRFFIYFDDLVNKYGVEKIKTIGDAYMCAGGVPDTDSANPIEVVLVGLEMISYVEERRASKDGFWNIRVGINTGPVISAHLGHVKRVFDIWGDSVNTASRMESSGEPGRVNISGNTYQKIQDFFDCEYRGKMPVKYKGEIEMYFVKRLKEEYCLPGSTCQPNALLLRKLQILKISDFEQRVIDTTMKGVHGNVLERMDMFLSRVRMLAVLEGLSDDDTLTCHVAAILCFVQEEFPKANAILDRAAMRELMRRMHLSDAQQVSINKVVGHVAQGKAPDDCVEEVIADAFNEVFGRKDMIPLLMKHYDDVAARGTKLSRDEWMESRARQLKDLVFYTAAAKRLCEVPQRKQIEAIGAVI